jgi:hypothetical protein
VGDAFDLATLDEAASKNRLEKAGRGHQDTITTSGDQVIA